MLRSLLIVGTLAMSCSPADPLVGRCYGIGNTKFKVLSKDYNYYKLLVTVDGVPTLRKATADFVAGILSTGKIPEIDCKSYMVVGKVQEANPLYYAVTYRNH